MALRRAYQIRSFGLDSGQRVQADLLAVAAGSTSIRRQLGQSANIHHPLRRRFAISARLYKGFTIVVRSFQTRGSGRWSVDFLIGRRGSLRAFSGNETHNTELAAATACWELGRRIIDRSAPDCAVDQLAGE